MNAVIVDTNVIVIANDTDDKRADCRDLCQDRLHQIISRREKVVIDNNWRILKEYERNTKPNTRKGIGDVFVKTLLRNQKNANFCAMVHITPLAGNGTEFKEFPTDNALRGFDPDDRKFIAVAIAHQAQFGQTATILLAIDSGWTNYITALAAHSVDIHSICEEDTS
ncbi:MAG: PIN domain-containing protein [Candidatus Poribacteria bacterium]|nr:PIN domain-containing protein [Candidatus Poribacteria bacterium]